MIGLTLVALLLGGCAITSDLRPGMPTTPLRGQTAERKAADKVECKERADAGTPPFGERLGRALFVPVPLNDVGTNCEATYASCMREKGYR
jgi:hypothetical protein